MGQFFPKIGKKSHVTNHDITVLQMKKQRDNLLQYKIRLEANLEKERQVAKRLLAEGKRDKAKLLLKKKRYQENLLDKNENYIEQVENLIHSVEFANTQALVVQNLKLGNECLKKLNQLYSIEDVEKIMDDTQEAAEYQKQIEQIISRDFTPQDETDVMHELDQLIYENMNFPEVPAEAFPTIDNQKKLPSTAKEKIALAA